MNRAVSKGAPTSEGLLRYRTGQLAVVYGKDQPWAFRHAAEEFARLASALTGQEVLVTDDAGPEGACAHRVLVGNAATNRIVMGLVRDGRLPFDGTSATDERFVMCSATADGVHYLILAGGNPRAVLYCVYDYFERFCDVGYFWDGDRIPRAEGLPFFGIDVAEEPTFRYRVVRYFGHRGLKRFHPEMWDLGTWQREMDWLVKNKFNMLVSFVGIPADLLQQAFPGEVPYPPDGREVSYVLERPGLHPDDRDAADLHFDPSWIWPLQSVRELHQEVLRYGRALGLRNVTTAVGPGPTPPKGLRDAHPEWYTISDDSVWLETHLDPYYPKAWEYYRRVSETALHLMGNDHAHGGGCPCAESQSGRQVYDLIRLKMHTHLMTERLVQQVDPGGLWVVDTWDYGCTGAWKNEEVRALLRALGKENYLALDIWADDNTRESYRDWGFFEDHDWGIGLLHGFAGEDEIAGDRAFILERTQAVLRDPTARRCIAFAYLDEKNHDDTMYAQLMARLAWRPQDLTLESFLEHYAVRRYGRAAAPQMTRSMISLCEGVKHTQRQGCWYQWTTYIPAHRSYYDHLYGGALFGPEQEEPVRTTVERVARSAPHLLEALERALAAQEQIEDQAMYETDLVDIARTLLADLISLALGRAFLAYLEATRCFARGDSAAAAVAGFEHSAAQAQALVLSLEHLLATRDDFSLARSVEEVLQTPGVNSWSDMALRQRAENPYNRSHVFELVHRIYRDDVAAYIALLRQHLDEGEPSPVTVKDEGFRRALNAHSRRFYEGPLAVPRTYAGTTLEAVRDTFALARTLLAA